MFDVNQNADTPGARRAARSERRREHTRIEILDVARDVIVRDGLGGFSLSAVADELGLTKPALYYYFDSRETLVFELLLREWLEQASEVQLAVERTDNGADAVEQLMRTIFARYHERLALFMLVHTLVPGSGLGELMGPDQLARIRPVNQMLYGRAEQLVRADQRAGKFLKQRNPRRFVFNAHMAVNGILNMKAMTESFGDPLVHKDKDLIDDICETFRSAALVGEKT